MLVLCVGGHDSLTGAWLYGLWKPLAPRRGRMIVAQIPVAANKAFLQAVVNYCLALLCVGGSANVGDTADHSENGDPVAQRLARRIADREVSGSNPAVIPWHRG